MANLQIKNLPDEMHAELQRRARGEGLTIRDYVLRLIQHDQLIPPRTEWFARIRARRPLQLDQPAAELIAADRAERAAELERR